MTPGQTCQVGGRFSKCHNPAEHVCQYCGRAFCAAHTDYIADHEAVCSRKQCHAKRVDLEEHLAYKARILQRNRAGLCGVEGCGPHPGFECSLCLGLFCGTHLRERHYPFQEGRVVVERPVSICAHCWERRKIWRAR